MVERLSGVLGQERAVGLLKRYISAGAVPQGLLFTGEEGIGKEKAARAFAAALLCREPGEDGACGVCPDCRLLASSSHPNFLFIAPETQFLRIDEIRALQEELSLKAFSDRPRAAILCPADRMTPQASNALLKTLEEPPPETHLLLVAHRIAAMMPTIVSRCQKVPFFPLPAGTAAEILSGHPDAAGASPALLRLACAVSGGSPGRALALLPGLSEERERWLSLFAKPSPREALELAESYKGDGDEPGRLAAPLALARDLALLSSGGGTDIMNEDLREQLSAAAALPPPGGWDAAFRTLLAISRMPPQPQKRLMLEAFFFGLRRKG
ncbi:MAG: DNA polymerase III subunit delta' [Thermodesulfobacteriota bacterium]